MNVVSMWVRSISDRGALVISMLVLLGISSAAQAQPVEYVQNGYAGAADGEWSQGGSVIGVPDGSCRAMGAEGKVNLLSDFGFNLPGDAVITDIAAHVKAGSNQGQNVSVTLASDATVDPPTLLSSSLVLATANVGQGNCGSTIVTSVSAPPGSWGTTSANLLAVVNNTAFGLVFTKVVTSNVKVDAVCLEITYTSATGENIQEACFSEPPPESNTITVEKTVVGAAPGSDWDFTGDLDPFTFPAAGGFQAFPDLVDGTYTISETTKEGYEVSVACYSGQTLIASGVASVDVAVAGDISVTCEFINTEIIPEPPVTHTTFTVQKTFSDGNSEQDVTINIQCFTGLPLNQSQTVSTDNDIEFEVEFVVESFEQGTLDCDVWEDEVDGYTGSYVADSTVSPDYGDTDEGCYYNDIDTTRAGLEQNLCTITNDPNPVEVVFIKEWVIEGSGGDDLNSGYELELTCDGEIFSFEADQDGLWRWTVSSAGGTGGSSNSARVIPDWDGGSDCWVEETVYDSSIEVDNGCVYGNLHIEIGQGASCTITNTVFYEGIPTLSQYGMAIMALLMLGVGFVGFRRFA